MSGSALPPRGDVRVCITFRSTMHPLFFWEAVINLAPIWRAQSGELFLSGGAPNLAPAGRRSGEVQSGESLADLAGLLAAGNCMAQPIWRNAQSGVELILKPSWAPAGTSWAPAGHQLVPAGTSWYQLVPAGTQRSPDWASRQNGCATQFPASRIPARSARLSPDWARQIGAQLAPDWEVRQNGKVRQIDPARTAPDR